MHFFTFLAQPQAGVDPDGTVGAYVNCWIEQPTREVAEARARELISDEAWNILEIEEYNVVGDEDYANGGEGCEYYQQALIDHEVLVFYTWPASGEDEDRDDAG